MTFPIIRGHPEEFFGVHDISPAASEMEVRARSAKWLEGTEGDAPAGSLGVPADNATGYAVIAGAPPGHWSVTTELSADILGPIPTDGIEIVATAALVHGTGSTGFAEGAVVDERERTLARIRQRGRFVGGFPDEAGPVATKPPPHDGPRSLSKLFGLSGAGHREPGEAEIAVTTSLANPQGNLHGGVGFCLVDWMAAEVFRGAGDVELRTSSVHIAFLRPSPLGTTVHVATEALHRGRTFGLARVTVSLPNGKPACIATVAGGAE